MTTGQRLPRARWLARVQESSRLGGVGRRTVRGYRVVAGSVDTVRLLLVGMFLSLLFVGCGDDESASDAVEELVEALSASDYAAAYDMLHPAHQAVVSEEVFVDCGQQQDMNGPARVDAIEITGELERTRDVPELGEIEVTVVAVNLTQGDEVFPRTWDVVKDDGEWRWMLGADTLVNYREGRCTSAAASPGTASSGDVFART
ncbi:MAG: DUF4878 domain-containing protein [Chloroflexota bacterium]|nr:DUF4878 domain-containing protein [Chloroflexota bacterium]